jgi:hypothetical protein
MAMARGIRVKKPETFVRLDNLNRDSEENLKSLN